jgi:hypothetical protein
LINIIINNINIAIMPLQIRLLANGGLHCCLHIDSDPSKCLLMVNNNTMLVTIQYGGFYLGYNHTSYMHVHNFLRETKGLMTQLSNSKRWIPCGLDIPHCKLQIYLNESEPRRDDLVIYFQKHEKDEATIASTRLFLIHELNFNDASRSLYTGNWLNFAKSSGLTLYTSRCAVSAAEAEYRATIAAARHTAAAEAQRAAHALTVQRAAAAQAIQWNKDVAKRSELMLQEKDNEQERGRLAFLKYYSGIDDINPRNQQSSQRQITQDPNEQYLEDLAHIGRGKMEDETSDSMRSLLSGSRGKTSWR